jgi:transposase
VQNNTALKAKQIGKDELIVGIDPHKHKHWVVLMTAEAEVVKRFRIENSLPDFRYLREELGKEAGKRGASRINVAIEAGGHYWHNLGYYLLGQGCNVCLISPFTLKRMRDGMDQCRRKNDFRDALAAGELLLRGNYNEGKPIDGEWAQLRSLYQAWDRLKRERASAVNLLRGLLDSVFPEVCEVFSDPCGQSVMEALRLYPIPQALSRVSEEEFIDEVRASYEGHRLAVGKLRALYRRAGESIGVGAGSRGKGLEIQLIVERLKLMDRQLGVLKERIRDTLKQFRDSGILLSVPGVGEMSVAGLLSEIGPIEQYHDAKDLVKLAGVNPTASESGGKAGRYTPMSKKGRALLRGVLWQASLRLIAVNQEFREWADRMRKREGYGKLNQRQILGAAMNKLLRLIFALLSRKEMYRSEQGLSLAA